MESIVLAVLAFAAGAFAAVVATTNFSRAKEDEPLDWQEEAYQPRLDQPRAVTRIKSKSIFWEIN